MTEVVGQQVGSCVGLDFQSGVPSSVCATRSSCCDATRLWKVRFTLCAYRLPIFDARAQLVDTTLQLLGDEKLQMSLAKNIKEMAIENAAERIVDELLALK